MFRLPASLAFPQSKPLASAFPRLTGNRGAKRKGIGLLAAALTLSGLVSTACSFEEKLPEVTDSSLKIELISQQPDLRTPTGLAVDHQGRVFVIECHTHFRPANYDGPPADRIRLYVDSDGNGVVDKVSTFFEGTTATMNVAAFHDGSLFVATRNEIFRLYDENKDGVSDRREDIAKLETKGNYPHNGLSGFAFDSQENVYVGFGENLGEPYELIGSDGVRLSGGGEGGSIFRCRPDGSKLSRFATGYWNPFHVTSDSFDRVFAVDNDPDWRPPCRLLHVVQGGDYGYRFSLGRRGTHPFTSWFGDKPGMLGMVSGTGEAPSGVLVYRSSNLPASYQGTVLATAWGVHSIERYQLNRVGASVTSATEIIVKGDEEFRPVGMVTAPDGSIYISDWVKRDYELHGHGRLWRLSSKEENAGVPFPEDSGSARKAIEDASDANKVRAAARILANGTAADLDFARSTAKNAKESWVRAEALGALAYQKQLSKEAIKEVVTSQADIDLRVFAVKLYADLGWETWELFDKDMSPEVLAEVCRRSHTQFDLEQTKSLWSSKDPFVRQAIVSAAARLSSLEEVVRLPLTGDDLSCETIAMCQVQVGNRAKLAKEADVEASITAMIRKMLAHPAERVQFIGLRWIGEDGIESFRDEIEKSLTERAWSPKGLESAMATLELLAGKKGAQYEAEQIAMLNKMVVGEKGELPESTMVSALRLLYRAALRDRLNDLPTALKAGSLAKLAQHPKNEVRIEAIRILCQQANPDQGLLATIADDRSLDEEVRMEALLGLTDAKVLKAIGESSDNSATLRLLAFQGLLGAQVEKEDEVWISKFVSKDEALMESFMRWRGLKPSEKSRPKGIMLPEWNDWIKKQKAGDAQRGEIVFFHNKLGRCASCHAVQGRGADIGPDLSEVGEMGGERIWESLIDPSREVAPKFMPWNVTTTDGATYTGLLVTERGSDQFYVDSQGKPFTVHHNDIENLTASKKSLMPDGLLESLTDSEIRDLVAYLNSLKRKP